MTNFIGQWNPMIARFQIAGVAAQLFITAIIYLAEIFSILKLSKKGFDGPTGWLPDSKKVTKDAIEQLDNDNDGQKEKEISDRSKNKSAISKKKNEKQAEKAGFDSLTGSQIESIVNIWLLQIAKQRQQGKLPCNFLHPLHYLHPSGCYVLQICDPRT